MGSVGGDDARAAGGPAAKALGGFLTGAELVDGTVRRGTGPWTPSVHALLAHLRDAGVDRVPEVLGIDAEGREMLQWFDGEPVVAPASDAQLRGMGGLLRQLHDAAAGFTAPRSARWRGVAAPRPGAGEIVCHLDLQPWNVLARGDEIVAVIDWDLAGPAPATADVGFVAWSWIPLAGAGPFTPEHARRLGLLLDAYGADRPMRTSFSDALIDAVDRHAGLVSHGISTGDARLAGVADAPMFLSGNEHSRRWFATHREAIDGAARGRLDA